MKNILLTIMAAGTLMSAAASDNLVPTGYKVDLSQTIPVQRLSREVSGGSKRAPLNISGEKKTYESSCYFLTDLGSYQFDYGYCRPVVIGEGNQLEIDHLQAEFLDEDHTIIGIPSKQHIKDYYVGPIYWGCAIMQGDQQLGLMDEAVLYVDGDGVIYSPELDYFGDQYFIEYDDTGAVWHIEKGWRMWEIDTTTPVVPESATGQWYQYNCLDRNYKSSNTLTKFWFDGDDVYVTGLVPYIENTTVKGTMKNGNIVIPSSQLLMINGNYTERLIVTRKGEEISNLILYYDQATKSYSAGNDVVIYGGSSLKALGYCNPYYELKFTPYTPPKVRPKGPDNCKWVDGTDNRMFTFTTYTQSEFGEQLYPSWIGVELLVDGEVFTFKDEDYGGNLMKDYTRLPLGFFRFAMINDTQTGWGNLFDVENGLYGIVLPDDFDYTLMSVRTVYTVDGVDYASPSCKIPAKTGTQTITGNRVVLLEEFTTERCSNCPAAKAMVEQMMEKMTDEERSRMAVVCHHVGFYDDDFTIPASESLLWYFSGTGTYAPAFMCDRTTVSGASDPIFTCPSSWQLFRSKMLNSMSQPEGTSIAINSAKAENGILQLEASGTLADNVTAQDLRFTVYVVENNVRAVKQAGTTGEYIHDHVARAANSSFGDNMIIHGKDWTWKGSLELPSGLNTNNCQLIAFVNRYYPTSREKSDVLNTIKVDFNDFGITSVGDLHNVSEVIETVWVNLAGQTISEPTEGVAIRIDRMSDGSLLRTKVIK